MTAVVVRDRKRESFDSKPAKDTNRDFQGFIGNTPAMQAVYEKIDRVATTDIPVLLSGETGTGKEIAARAIHRLSRRAEGPFVPVNLGALPRELVASELFGHEKGAFTGAVTRRSGKFEQAAQGDVFLDEIDTAAAKVQVSLLRLIEHKEFQRIGSAKHCSSDARIITASNQNLHELVEQGQFREDLYYRLNVFQIDMPPLRQRKEDISILATEFLKMYRRAFQKRNVEISSETLELLLDYSWPGNVRELKNVIQRAVLVCSGNLIQPDHLPYRLHSTQGTASTVTLKIGTTFAEMEREIILKNLEVYRNNRKKVAQVLGISRHALYNRLNKYGIK